jgi:hypothetical protein
MRCVNAWIMMTVMRKNLFQVLDRAIQGDTVEIVYKGSKVRLPAPSDGSVRDWNRSRFSNWPVAARALA